MKSLILFLHAEDDHLVPIHIAQQVRLILHCKLSWYFTKLKSIKLLNEANVLFWMVFAFSPQLYEVAASTQNAERVKLVSFDGSLGYLHNGLYKDPHLPDIIKWENISLIMLKVFIFWLDKSVSVKRSVLYCVISPLQEVCAVVVKWERRLKQKTLPHFSHRTLV